MAGPICEALRSSAGHLADKERGIAIVDNSGLLGMA